MKYFRPEEGYEAEFLQVQILADKSVKRSASITATWARSWKVTLAPLIPFTYAGQLVEPTFGGGIFALVTWGQGQVEHKAEVDWGRGGSFVVHGTNVYVDLVNNPTTVIPVGWVASTMQTGATIVPARDGDTGVNAPTATLYTGNIAAGNTTRVRIPRYARAFRWYVSASNKAGNAAVNVQFFVDDDQAGSVRRFVSVTGDLTTAVNSWPEELLGLPAPGQYLGIVNQDGAATIALTLEFQLDLG